MAHGQGNNRGYRPNPPRGRGQGRGRGRGRGGRGGGSRGNFPAAHVETHALGGDLVFVGDFEDFTLDPMIPSSHNGFPSPVRESRGHQSSRGFQSGRGRNGKVVRGLGFSGGLRGPRIPLSTLEKDRPLLRPILFVRGEHQKTLFQEVEEILHAPGEPGEAINDHVPSADIVERIFHREELVDEVPPSSDVESTSEVESGDPEEANVTAIEPAATEEAPPAFVVDTTPGPVAVASKPSEIIMDSSIMGAAPLGEAADDDIIVYVAPHPRSGRGNVAGPPPPIPASEPSFPSPGASATQVPPPPHPSVSTTVDAFPISSVPTVDPELVLSKQVQAREKIRLKPTHRSRKMAKKERAAARRREERKATFSMASMGLSMEERSALQEGSTIKNDPQYTERRRDDSDVYWGTDDESAIEGVRSGIGDMDLDGDAGEIAALARFARGVEGLGEEVVTIADFDDVSRMREEDEVDTDEDQDEESVFDAEERKEIGENGDVDSSGSSEEDTPRRSFQGRLQMIRAKAKVKTVNYASSSSDAEKDSDAEGIFKQDSSWADRDEDYLELIEDLLDKNMHLLRGEDRKARNAFFKAAHGGKLKDDYEALIPSNMRKKDRDIPPELCDQWERDRAKKAERKRLRALARLQSAANISPTRKSSRRKEKVLGGARVQGNTVYADRVHDLGVLEELIRSFLGNLEMVQLVLPPKRKDWRKRAHLLAEAFNLKSKSTGKGEGRFMTLIKTTRSGINVNERKIYRLVSGDSGEGFKTFERGAKPVRHRDGDEVGKMAPRLSDSNVGFKLLQQMGWEEGGRIGVTGGLADPLTAIIKTTRLGLGATR